MDKVKFKAYSNGYNGTEIIRRFDYYEWLEKHKSRYIIVELSLYTDDISTHSRGYYFFYNRWLIQNTEDFGGWTENELHEYAIDNFGIISKAKMIGKLEVVYQHRISLSNCSQKEFNEFFKQWQRFVNEQGHVPPEPNTALYD